jgi:tRNA threonylcarbamoyladenosine biosynthesis protein TsaE
LLLTIAKDIIKMCYNLSGMRWILLLMVTSASEELTRRLGMVLGELSQAGSVIALIGELGAGKTVFARGVADGLKVNEAVSSPSYVLMNLYRGRLELYHFDFYRLENEEELDELGLDEYFYGEGVSLVEWADKFPGVMPPTRVEIEIVKDPRDLDNSRVLYFKQMGKENGFLFEELKRVASACN